MPKISFYFDYRSPYAYLAHTQLRKLGVETSYHPFDIRALMEKTGNVPTSVICKPKNRYIQADLRRWVSHYGVPFQRHPQVLEIDARRLLRATLWAIEQGRADDTVSALFDAMWAEPRPLQTVLEVASVLKRERIEGSVLEAELDGPLWEMALERATAAAVERGVFGAPCMFVGDEMFFGNDRLHFVRAALERAT